MCVSLLVRITFVLHFHEGGLPPSTNAAGLSSYSTVFIHCQFISLITIINKAFDTSYYKVNWDKSEEFSPVPFNVISQILVAQGTTTTKQSKRPSSAM